MKVAIIYQLVRFLHVIFSLKIYKVFELFKIHLKISK